MMIENKSGDYNRLIKKTLEFIALYYEHGLQVPDNLIQNIGDFIIAKKLYRRFSSPHIHRLTNQRHNIFYHGRQKLNLNIEINNLKIKVETQKKLPPEKSSNKPWEYDLEKLNPISPTAFVGKDKVDIIIGVILYFNDDHSEIEKEVIYIFNKNDFKYFKNDFCPIEDYKTIAHILYVKGELPIEKKRKVDFYNKSIYKNLFLKSENNWEKIKSLL